MRELHWQATAAEWAFVVSRRVRTTVVDPAGRSETNDFQPVPPEPDLPPLQGAKPPPLSMEWQYLLTGRVKVTLFGSRGRYREETLDAGDVGYIP